MPSGVSLTIGQDSLGNVNGKKNYHKQTTEEKEAQTSLFILMHGSSQHRQTRILKVPFIKAGR